MEWPLFEALSSLLDLCVWSINDGTPFLPRAKEDIFQIKPHDAAPDSRVVVGELVYRLGDIGVLADHLSSFVDYVVGGDYLVRYERKVYVITPKNLVKIRGILFTPLGNAIAKFYEPRWNATGLKIFEDWKASLGAGDADVREGRLTEEGDVQL